MAQMDGAVTVFLGDMLKKNTGLHGRETSPLLLLPPQKHQHLIRIIIMFTYRTLVMRFYPSSLLVLAPCQWDRNQWSCEDRKGYYYLGLAGMVVAPFAATAKASLKTRSHC